jgi:hypothetical protein
MQILQYESWMRRGISLLWQAEALAKICSPDQAVSIRHFLDPAQLWRNELPAANGNALVVVGVEGCIDTLTPEDAETWIEEDLKPRIFDFQNIYDNQAALIFWLPAGRQRIRMDAATEEYNWLCSTPFSGQAIALGRQLWAGAESDVYRIVDVNNQNADYDGTAWIGLYHPRIS